MDFEKYKIRLTIRACCLYEQMSGKNFMKMTDADDMLLLLYCSIVANNDDLLMTYKVFLTLVQDEKVAKWLEKEYKKMTDFSNQLKTLKVEEGEVKDGTGATESLTMTEIASSLIIQHGVDAHYVMNEMQLWEIFPFLTAADNIAKSRMVEKRFWTYLQISPHINTKKCREPDDLFKFSWEKENDKKKLEVNTGAALAFLSKQNNKEEENGEQ